MNSESTAMVRCSLLAEPLKSRFLTRCFAKWAALSGRWYSRAKVDKVFLAATALCWGGTYGYRKLGEVDMSKQTRLKNGLRTSAWLSVLATSAVLLGACGGGGYSGGSGGGSNSCGGPYGAMCPPVSAGSPTVAFAGPGETANRTVALSATPTAPNGVTRVEFLVDGTVVGTATTSPYTTNWDTFVSGDGPHSVVARVTDAMSLTALSPARDVNVANTITIALALKPEEEEVFPQPVSTATGTGQLVVNLHDGSISGNFTVTNLAAIAAHIHDGYAGNAGLPIITMTNNTTANRWDVPANSILTAAQIDKLLGGALYVNAHSAAHLAGEIRAQILPASVRVIFGAMNGAQETPAVTTTATGLAAVTVDTLAGTASIHLNSIGVDDGTAAHIQTGAAGVSGPPLITLTKDPDPLRMGHWSAEKQAITTGDQTSFNNSAWYANILTPAHPAAGEIRGQITVTAPAATTLTQLQAAIFTPICSVCHTGGGTSLPSSMNFTTTANTYAALVGVASVEQGALMRVAPKNVASSYVIHKLEGISTITGVRMPFGGPYLTQPTIDTVKSWINSGAPNN